MTVELKVPSAGESVADVEIGEWLKAEGDHVERDEAVVRLETDKASMEVPAPASGTLASIRKEAGDMVEIGEVIAEISTDGAGAAKEDASRDEDEDEDEAEPDAEARAPQERESPEESADEAEEEDAESAEAENEIEIVDVASESGGDAEEDDEEEGEPEPEKREKAESEPESGTEPKPEAKAEAKAKAKAKAKAEPKAKIEEEAKAEEEKEEEEEDGEDGAAGEPERRKAGTGKARRGKATADGESAVGKPSASSEDEGDEVVRMSLLRRGIARRLVEAQQRSALLTTFQEIDASALLALRRRWGGAFEERHGTELGIMSLFVKASIEALKEVPELNAEIRGDDIVYHRGYHIGIAVGVERGLVVPVLRSADRMSLARIEEAIDDFVARAESGALEVDELRGGTFTITNGGIFGSLLSTPLVNPPQSGVLGMHAIQERPVARDGAVEIRPMMYVALTYDHRIVDGRESVRFLQRVKEVIEAPERLLLEA